MTLSALIRKREVATATVATSATQEQVKAPTVAKVATVAVANPESLKTINAEDEAAVLAWLASIGETDPQEITDALAKCASDPDALAYCLEQAAQMPPDRRWPMRAAP